MADLAGPQKSEKKDEEAKKRHRNPRNPRKTLEIPEDSVRDPRGAENCQKNAVLCHLAQKNAPEERRFFRRLPKNPENWIQTLNVTNSSLF